MKFNKFSSYLAKIESTSLRLEITSLLARLFSRLSPDEGKQAAYLLLGQLAPNYQGLDFNLAGKTILKILSRTFNRPLAEIKGEYKKVGDLGQLAFSLAQKADFESRNLSISQVYNLLLEIAQQEGEGSVARKQHLMANLLRQLNPLSIKYVVRIPVARLRLGFSEVTILDALSWMLVGDKSLRPFLEKAFNVRSDIGIQVEMVLKAKLDKVPINKLKLNLTKITALPGIPIRSALASRLSSFADISAKLGRSGLEPKYDGLRTQIHAWRRAGEPAESLFASQSNVEVKVFSRNLENIGPMFPEIKESATKLLEAFNLEGVILDSESIAYDSQTGVFYPFQETIKRKRKYNISQFRQDRPIKTFVFDILFFGKEDLLSKPLKQRRKYLTKLLKQPVGCLNLTPQHVVVAVKEMKKWFNQYIEQGLEGIMVKKLDSNYQAGSRNFNWVKFKPSAMANVEDTLDLVVLGWYQGKGKRNKFGIGAFLVGLYDPNKDEFLTVSKIGTGLTDDQWRQLYSLCQKSKTIKKPANYQVPKELACDLWTEPNLVVEVKADQITKSPLHTSGYALRFPRLVRFRKDKLPTQATTAQEIKNMINKR